MSQKKQLTVYFNLTSYMHLFLSNFSYAFYQGMIFLK